MSTICLIGASGRMGQTIQSLLPDTTSKICFSRLSKENTQELVSSIKKSDYVIDFSHPANFELALSACLLEKKPYMCCTTGLTSDHFELLKSASEKIPVIYASNNSLGIVILKKAVELVAKIFSEVEFGENIDIAISETHHNLKKDAPSGTSLSLGNIINQIIQNKSEINYSSIRGGNVVGEHTVHFFHNDEVIKLSHECLNRNVFANGAIKAGNWLVKQQPGFYSLDNVLGLK